MKVMKLATALLFSTGLASAAPCTQAVSVLPESPVTGYPVSIDYTAPFLGFVQSPTIAIVGNQITIDQPTVHADPAFAGDVPCGERLVSAGYLVAGNYNVTVRLSSFPAMSGSFTVRPATVTVCGFNYASSPPTGPQGGTITAAVKASGRTAFLHFENHGFADVGSFQAPLLGAPVVSIEGSQIHVTQTYDPFTDLPVSDGLPPLYSLFCQSEDVDLGSLGAGTYTLVWTYLTNRGPVSVTATVTNGLSPRGRAVRGH